MEAGVAGRLRKEGFMGCAEVQSEVESEGYGSDGARWYGGW